MRRPTQTTPRRTTRTLVVLAVVGAIVGCLGLLGLGAANGGSSGDDGSPPIFSPPNVASAPPDGSSTPPASPAGTDAEASFSVGAALACQRAGTSSYAGLAGSPIALGATLTAAFLTTASVIPLWQAALGSQVGAPPTGTPPPGAVDEQVTICYFDGAFGQPAGTPLPSGMGGWDRVVMVLHADGAAQTVLIGWKPDLPIIDPANVDTQF